MALPEDKTYIYTDTLKENMALAVYNTGLQHCRPSHHPARGVRDYYMVHYVLSGKGIYEVNGTVYHLGAEDMFFTFPDSVVYYEADSKEPWTYCWVAFNGVEASRILRRIGLSVGNPILRLEEPEVLYGYLKNIYRVSGKTPAADVNMSGYFMLFFSELMRRTTEDGAKGEQQVYLTQALEYISRHYTHPLRVDEIAAHVNVSRSQLYRAFTKKLGVSPNEYIKQYRVNEACALLRRKEMPIGEIAAAVGFNDPLYFSRVFREVKGVPPSAYQHEE